jgi:hypothetical protein
VDHPLGCLIPRRHAGIISRLAASAMDERNVSTRVCVFVCL